jgi:hypothetical protein
MTPCTGRQFTQTDIRHPDTFEAADLMSQQARHAPNLAIAAFL